MKRIDLCRRHEFLLGLLLPVCSFIIMTIISRNVDGACVQDSYGGQCVAYVRNYFGGSYELMPGLCQYHPDCGARHAWGHWDLGFGSSQIPRDNSIMIMDKFDGVSTGHMAVVISVDSNNDGTYTLNVQESNWDLDELVDCDVTYSFYLTDSEVTRKNGTNRYPILGFIYGQPLTRCMDFEDEVDGEVIRSKIPGMYFTTTQGYDWIYGDKTTGNYNVYPYGTGAYVCNGNFFVWLGVNQGMGRIDFTGETATRVSMWTSCYYPVSLEAYNSAGNQLDSAYTPGNLWTGSLSELSVTASNIAYVLVHDQGNYWLIDDLCVQDLLAETETYLPENSDPSLEILETLDQGQSETHSFENSLPQILDIVLNWFGSEMKLAVYRPDGSLYGEWQSDAPPIISTVTDADTGTWEFEVTAIDVPEDDYPYALIVGTRSLPFDVYLTSSDISFSPQNPLPGDTVIISAVIHSDTLSFPVDSVKVCFYNGNPDSARSNTQIDRDQMAYNITAATPDTVQATWVFPDTTCHNIYVKVDLDNELKEWNRDNNQASGLLLLTVPATVELVPDRLDLTPGFPPVKCYIEFPMGYQAKGIDKVTLSGCTEKYIEPYPDPWEIGDYDGDGRLDLMVTFDQLAALRIVDPRHCGVATVRGLVPGLSPFEKFALSFQGIDTLKYQLVGGYICGLVTTNDNQEPISGVTVKILKDTLVVSKDTTDVDGHYSISYVLPDIYEVLASKKDYGSLSQRDVESIEAETTVVNFQFPSVGVPQGKEVKIPRIFSLSQNYPNPFNPVTTIRYGLPKDACVKLTIYNISGQRVCTLVDERQGAGYKMVNWDAGQMASGIYFYRIEAGDFTETRKMILLR